MDEVRKYMGRGGGEEAEGRERTRNKKTLGEKEEEMKARGVLREEQVRRESER